MALGIDVGANPPTAVLAIHVLVGLAFVGLGANFAANGRPVGLALNGLIAALVVIAGVAAARILARR